jgi:ABC-type transport system substrate-binding protein
MEYLYIADPMVRLASFQAGEGDVLLALEPQDAKTLKKVKGVQFLTCNGTNIGLAGDGDHPDSPFADIRVRQAIEYAIDREPVVEAIGLGFWITSDLSCAPTSWGHYPGPSPYSYDPKKAKQLLAEAGYPNGLNLPFVVRNNPAAWLDLYTAILAQLNEAGFNLHLQVVDPARFNEYAIKTAWKNALLGLNFSDSADASRILVFGWSSFGFPYRAVKHYDEIDNTVQEITATDDFEVKKAKTQEAYRLIRDKYCTVTNICLDTLISARHGYVHDDGFFATTSYQSTIEDAWMDK